jgi:membrane protease YdiL (CAAX protease family)
MMAIIPFLLFVVSNPVIRTLTFFLIGLLFIVTRYVVKLEYLNDTLEIIFLYVLIDFLLGLIGLDRLFPLNHVVSIGVLYSFLFFIKKTNANRSYLKAGKIKNTVLIGVIFALISVIGLSAWFILQKKNPYADMLPELPLVLLILAGIGFAIINSIYEEGIFRGIFFSYFSRETGTAPALVLQAIWFSFFHYRAGFPSGETGVALTFGFGIMMGYLVFRTRGILVPVIIHFVADLTVFFLILSRIKGLI